MTSADINGENLPGPPVGLDISRPGSSARRTSLFVKSPPFLGDEKARELEKDGLLSGLAPPSQILDGSMPLVELEANRLQDAMAWVYESVQMLQSQSTAVESRISGLQEALQQLNQSPIEAMMPPMSEVSRVETPDSPKSPTDQSGGLKRVILQLERKYAANEKLFEMRLDSLKRELDQRLQRKDLQDYQSQITEQLDSFESKSRVDMGTLGSMIHTESAAERRRIQTQLEVVSKRITAQMENWENLLQESTDKHDAALQKIEARLLALESVDVGSLSDKLAALPQSPQKSKRNSAQGNASPGSQRGSLNANEEARFEYLEAAVTQVEARLAALGARTSSPALTTVEEPTGMNASLLQDLSLRLKQLESRSDAPFSTGGGDDFHHQLMEFHRQHSDMHRQMLDLGSRLSGVEQLQLAGTSGGESSSAADTAILENRLTTAEKGLKDALQKIEDASKILEKGQKKSTASLDEFQRRFELLVKWVGGGRPTDEDDAHEESPSHIDDPFAWLERRISTLQKDKVLTIDDRIRRLEKDNPDSNDMAVTLKSLEKEFRAVDMKEFAKVRPELLEYQQHQESIDSDIIRELNELKCIVGCIEACIPRETRKAVQLFKRAAGSSEGAPHSPREFEVEGKILQLREDLETQIKDATDSLHKGRQDMTAVVKGLERKHEILDGRLQNVQIAMQAPPYTSYDEDRTRLHSAATNVSRDAPSATSSAIRAPNSPPEPRPLEQGAS